MIENLAIFKNLIVYHEENTIFSGQYYHDGQEVKQLQGIQNSLSAHRTNITYELDFVLKLKFIRLYIKNWRNPTRNKSIVLPIR